MTNPPCRPFLPPEWAPQSGVMLTWPHAHGDWATRLNAVESVFVNITREISLRERVLIVCYDENHREHVRYLLQSATIDEARLIFKIAPSNDTWARDHGPITVVCENKPRLLDFGFNGWGEKYPASLDNTITTRLYELHSFGPTPLERVDLILEGGSIEVDGSGSLLTTSRCLLAPTRNPGLSRIQLERRLGEVLGISRFLWLNHGYLAGDDTDSHIDTLARFCDPHTIAYVTCDNPDDEHYRELQLMAAELADFRAADDRRYRLVPLPWPQAKFNQDGRRLPATYANFLTINGAVLAPIYNDPADNLALAQLQTCFPDRVIIAIDCASLIEQFGSLHCVTMQLPIGTLDEQPLQTQAGAALPKKTDL